MTGRLGAWWSRRNTYDLLAVLFIVICLVLILVNISMYPVYLDIPYHMAVTEGFQEAGGVVTWDFWDYAPEGRPHIYPPLLHVAMSLMMDMGMSIEVVGTLVSLIMFPLILLSLWWAMRKLFSPRAALYSLILVGIPYIFFWQSAVTSAASLVLFLTPLTFVALEEDRKAAAVVLLALCLYSHLVMGHLVALALFIYMLHRRDIWKKILTILVFSYLLYLPWGINVLSNLSSFSASEPAAGGDVVLHLFLWLLAAAGFVLCYFRKRQYYLLAAYFLSMIPIVFFYSHRFWEGHTFLPLAMLGAVALDRFHAALKRFLSGRAPIASYARVLSGVTLALLLLLVFCVDPVLSSGRQGPSSDGPPVLPGGDRTPGGPEGIKSPPPDPPFSLPPHSQPEGMPHQPEGVYPQQPEGVYPPQPEGMPSQPEGVYPPQPERMPTSMEGYYTPRPLPYGEGTLPVPNPRTGGDMRAGLPRNRINTPDGDGLTLGLQPTTFLVLLGWEAPRMHGNENRQQIFGEENTALMEAIEEFSEPGDVVFTPDGILGDLVYAMTGRYSMQGMFHEVQPEEQPDPFTDADLAVIQETQRNRGAGDSAAGRLDRVPGGEEWVKAAEVGQYTVYVHEDAGSTGGAISSAALPLWAAYILLLLALGIVIVDMARKKPKEYPPGASPLPPRLYRPPADETEPDRFALAVVPAHNEEGAVGRVVEDIREACPGIDVLVIDDGSGDFTGKEALEAGALVLRMEENGGVGEAVRHGLAYAFSMGYRYAVRLDGDGQHPAGCIPRLLRPLERDEADVIVGSRFLESESGGCGISMPRRLGIAYFRAILRWSTSRDFTDPTSGFRAYSRRAMRFLACSDSLRYPEVTSLRMLARNEFAVREVPVKMIPRRHGKSSLRGLSGVAMVWGVTLEFLSPVGSALEIQNDCLYLPVTGPSR